MPNMKQVARMAGVSLGTVSHVLNDSAGVREHLRQRVLEVVEVLGYQPSQLARGLRRDKTNMIGMIIPDITNPFFPAVVRGAEDAAFGNGYRLVLCNTDNSESKEVAYMNELRTFLPAGMIVIPSNSGEATVQAHEAVKGGSALVCLDRLPRHWKGDTITVANAEGGRQAAEHLIELGHQRIATVTGPLHFSSATARLKGFTSALKKAAIALPPPYVQQSTFDGAGGYSAATVLLRLTPRPTAIFAQNDLMAMGVLAAIREAGLRCPEDISVFGFDGLEITNLMNPTLSSVVQPGYQLGSLGVQVLLERVQDPGRKYTHQVLPTELRLGGSVGPPPAAAARAAKRAVKRGAGTRP
jgi:DNA-binding LacI/PurR family transcriptional regulator